MSFFFFLHFPEELYCYLKSLFSIYGLPSISLFLGLINTPYFHQPAVHILDKFKIAPNVLFLDVSHSHSP